MTPHVCLERPHLRLSPFAIEGSGFPEAASDSREQRGRRSGFGREQILLVEDDRGVQNVLQGILENEGYAATTAENGRRALQTLNTAAPPDLIILDLRMPVMDGWEFRAAQKKDS